MALVAAGSWLWSTGSIAFSPYANSGTRWLLAGGFLLAGMVLWRKLPRRIGAPARSWALVLIAALPLIAWLVLLQPSTQRDWSPDQARLPQATIAGGEVTIANVRNFSYRSKTDYDARWETRRYDLERLATLWFVVEPFAGFPGAAHTFLSFGFEGGHYLAVSAEIRKERGENFSPWRGLYRNYELMYVLGDERDLIRLRTEQRKDTVYVYPVRATREQIRVVFLDVLARSNALAGHPEFYNSVTNTCTTNLVAHANALRPGLVPLSWRVLLPGHSDELAMQLGLIDFDGTLAQARERFRVNERAARAGDAPDFSGAIRAAQ